MKLPIFLAAAFLCSSAYAQHKHVHGEGRLDAAIDQDTITLNLELPLDAVVGFERAPKSGKEKASLAAAEKALEDVPFLPTPAAQCTLQSKEVEMPRFAGDEHADMEARYVFRCAAPAELKGVETTLFKQFKRLYRLETQRIGPSGQGAQRLTPKNPVLVW